MPQPYGRRLVAALLLALLLLATPSAAIPTPLDESEEPSVQGNASVTKLLNLAPGIDITCNQDPVLINRLPASSKRIDEGIQYLLKNKNMCGVRRFGDKKDHSWAQVSCSYSSGIYLHNLSPKKLDVPCKIIGEQAKQLKEHCAPVWEFVRPVIMGKMAVTPVGPNAQPYEIFIMRPKLERHPIFGETKCRKANFGP